MLKRMLFKLRSMHAARVACTASAGRMLRARFVLVSCMALAASPVLAATGAADSGGATPGPAPAPAPALPPVSSAMAVAPVAPASAISSPVTPTATRPFALSFGNIKVVSRSIVSYRCADGREMGVAYMNTDNQQSFAVIRINGRHVVFVDTAAASGVRYVAGRYVWWSKGDEGNLYDMTAGENAAPVAKDCKAIRQ